MVKLLYFHRFTREITVQLCKSSRQKRPKLYCVWISTCSIAKLLYFLLICSCEIPQKKICGLWLDTPTIRLKAKICNSRLWQQYILSSFCRHWCLRLVTRHNEVKSQMMSHFNKYCFLNNFARLFQSFFYTHITRLEETFIKSWQYRSVDQNAGITWPNFAQCFESKNFDFRNIKVVILWFRVPK